MTWQVPFFGWTVSATRQVVRRFMIEADGIAGTGLVEFAVIAPVMVVLCVPILDFGTVFFRQIEVQHAAQAGAQFAIDNGFTASAITSAVQNAAPITISASPAPVESCGCPSNSGVSQLHTGPCTSGDTCVGSVVKGTYVTVSARATYNPLAVLRASSIFGGTYFATSTYTLTSTATVRIE